MSDSSGLAKAVAEFGEKLADSLARGIFVRLLLSRAQGPDADQNRVVGRNVMIRGAPHLSLTPQLRTQHRLENFAIKDGVNWVVARLGQEFRNALLATTERDW